MKKVIFFVVATLSISFAFCQLKNTKWSGSLKGDNPRGAILDFGKDTLTVYSSTGSELIETMTYTTSGQTVTLIKINGQSDCDEATPGTYQFSIKNDKVVFKLASDACTDRSSALDATEWTKTKAHS